MRALITGGAGFAGSHLAEHLLAKGQEVVVLVHEQEGLSNLEHVIASLDIERGDLRNLDRLTEVLRETRPQHIYHLAALASPVDSFQAPDLTYAVNFTGSLNLFLACRNLEIDCRILYVSSADVYGLVRDEDLPLREDLPFRPSNPYSGSKAAAEILASQFFRSYGLPIIRVRPFNHTGPRQSSAYVCSNLARQVAEVDLGLRPPTVTVGNLKACRDFSDVRDIVRGYHLLLAHGEPGDVYQLCSGVPLSIEAILRDLVGMASKPIEVKVDQSRLRVQEASRIWGDFSKARQAVGWMPAYELTATLRDLKLCWEGVISSRRDMAASQEIPDERGPHG